MSEKISLDSSEYEYEIYNHISLIVRPVDGRL